MAVAADRDAKRRAGLEADLAALRRLPDDCQVMVETAGGVTLPVDAVAIRQAIAAELGKPGEGEGQGATSGTILLAGMVLGVLLVGGLAAMLGWLKPLPPAPVAAQPPAPPALLSPIPEAAPAPAPAERQARPGFARPDAHTWRLTP